MNKTCSKCTNSKPLSDFYKRKGAKDGYEYSCKVCYGIYAPRKQASKKFHNENKARQKTYNSSYYVKNAEKIKEATSEYRVRHSEWKTAYDKVYGRLWRVNNKDKVRSAAMKRLASKLNATPAWADFNKIEKIYRECVNLTRESGTEYQVDHIIPLQGENVCGLHDHLNLQIITATENRIKWNTFHEDNLNVEL